jgi:hypothetical protein
MKLLYVCLVIDLFLLRSMAYGQATVNEGLETAVIYVDTAKGSDSNPGTAASPLKTISSSVAKALQNNKLNIGTKVIIYPGIYRESIVISPNPSGQTAMPMTFQAATNGTVTVSGAVQYTGWAPYGAKPDIYFATWPNNWALCPGDTGDHPFAPDIVNRREMIIVNGSSLTQVLTLSEMMYPGTFFVDNTAGLVYVWPPSGTNMTTADVEVPTNPNLLTIQSLNSQTLNGVVVRGLSFQFANSCHSDSAVRVTGKVTNILLDTDTFQWNNGHGLNVHYAATNVTVANSVSNHNGSESFGAWQAKNVLWQNLKASYNNWRGAQGAYYMWGTSGLHLFSDHNDTISGLTLTYNQTFTIHWDTNNKNIKMDSVFAANNVIGVSVEKNDGPISITNSKFCSTVGDASPGGLNIRNSENTTISGTTIYDQSPNQVNIIGVAGGLPITDWETGQSYNLVSQNLTFTDNVIENVGTSQSLFRDGSLGGADWTAFQSTLKSDNNTWWDGSNPTSFVVPTPNNGTSATFAHWQSVTGQDLHSTFAAPKADSAAACAATADHPDFWLLTKSQQATADAAGNASFPLTLYSLGGLTGPAQLSIDLSSMPGATAAFSRSSVPLSGTSTLTVNAPAALAPGMYTFTVLANTGNITRTVALSVNVPATSVRLSTSSLDFGAVVIGVSSPARTVTLTNRGSKPINIASVNVSPGFNQTHTCGTSVAAGASCAISVTFSPKSLTTYSGNLTIGDSDPASPHVVALTGSAIGAPVVRLTPQSVAFDRTVYLSSSASKTITLQNTGTAALSIASILPTGPNSGDFTQTNNCGASVAINATCTITATFTPKASGTRSASISVASDAVGSPATVPLSGVELPAITITPKTLTFAPAVAGTKSAAKAVTVANASTAAMPITGITFSGAQMADFAQTNTCGSSLAGGGNCTINVTFTPGAAGTRSATLAIGDGDPSSPQSVTLSGTGTTPRVVLSPVSLSFGNQIYLKASAPQTVKLTNSGTGPLSIASISVTGANPRDFTQTNTCGATVAVNASCTITVHFTPTALGKRTASVSISDNASGSPQSVSLTGAGAPAISVSPTSLSFPSTPVNKHSAVQTIKVTNTSSTAIAIGSLKFGGTNSGDFTQTNTCGTSLGKGSWCNIKVTFTPAAKGARTGTLTISDGDPSSPQAVTLSGSGS